MDTCAGMADVLEIVGDLKDRVLALEQAATQPRELAPEALPVQPWAPCTREEVIFYAKLTDLH
jgi:hypothetical protein